MAHQKRSKEREKGRMKNIPHQPYSLAARFANEDQAARCYQELESSLRALHFDTHMSRLRLEKEGPIYVSFLHEGTESSIPPRVL